MPGNLDDVRKLMGRSGANRTPRITTLEAEIRTSAQYPMMPLLDDEDTDAINAAKEDDA